MNLNLARAMMIGGLVALVAGCGGLRSDGKLTEGELTSKQKADAQRDSIARAQGKDPNGGNTIWSLFSGGDDENTTVEVNKYLWQASLDVLDFLPIESVDPFTGVIVTGYGAAPGSGRAYRATIHVIDPALDARSLKVSLQGRGGAAVSPETQRAVEDAILTRARALRVQDSKL